MTLRPTLSHSWEYLQCTNQYFIFSSNISTRNFYGRLFKEKHVLAFIEVLMLPETFSHKPNTALWHFNLQLWIWNSVIRIKSGKQHISCDSISFLSQLFDLQLQSWFSQNELPNTPTFFDKPNPQTTEVPSSLAYLWLSSNLIQDYLPWISFQV